MVQVRSVLNLVQLMKGGCNLEKVSVCFKLGMVGVRCKLRMVGV